MTIEPLQIAIIPDHIKTVEEMDNWVASLTDEDYETIGTITTYEDDEE